MTIQATTFSSLLAPLFQKGDQHQPVDPKIIGVCLAYLQEPLVLNYFPRSCPSPLHFAFFTRIVNDSAPMKNCFFDDPKAMVIFDRNLMEPSKTVSIRAHSLFIYPGVTVSLKQLTLSVERIAFLLNFSAETFVVQSQGEVWLWREQVKHLKCEANVTHLPEGTSIVSIFQSLQKKFCLPGASVGTPHHAPCLVS